MITRQQFATALAFIIDEETESLTLNNLFQVATEVCRLDDLETRNQGIDVNEIREALIKHKRENTFD